MHIYILLLCLEQRKLKMPVKKMNKENVDVVK